MKATAVDRDLNLENTIGDSTADSIQNYQDPEVGERAPGVSNLGRYFSSILEKVQETVLRISLSLGLSL